MAEMGLNFLSVIRAGLRVEAVRALALVDGVRPGLGGVEVVNEAIEGLHGGGWS